MSTELSARSDVYWDFFISECVRLNAPLYSRLSAGVRDDERLSGLAALARPGQPMANLLFGAVHYLLLRGAQHPLHAHYKTLVSDGAIATGDPFRRFAIFARCTRPKSRRSSKRASPTPTRSAARPYCRRGFLPSRRERKVRCTSSSLDAAPD